MKLFVSIALLLILAACGSDKKEEVQGPPPEVSAFDNWTEQTSLSRETIANLSALAEDGERYGTEANFFQRSPLINREERDNVQNGYIYPLYFATVNEGFPSRSGEDGFTVWKGRFENNEEANKTSGGANESE